MSQEIIRQEISNLMDTINEQQQLILSQQGKIPQIEMDILLSNIRKVYERLMELNKMEQIQQPIIIPFQNSGENRQSNELIAISEAPITEEKVIFKEPVVENSVVDDTIQVTNEPTVIADTPVQAEIIIASVDTPVVTSADEVVTEAVLPQAALAKERVREFSKPGTKLKTTASLFDDAPTVADKFQGTPTLYDKISSAKEDKSLAGKLQKNPVSDLKKSIGINEKFSFINELFDGDLGKYNNAIEQLNNCGNINQANEVLTDGLAAQYNWSKEEESYIQLKNLLERRFSA